MVENLVSAPATTAWNLDLSHSELQFKVRHMMIWALSLSTMNLLTHSLSPTLHRRGIRSLSGFGNPVGPLAQSVLYPP